MTILEKKLIGLFILSLIIVIILYQIYGKYKKKQNFTITHSSENSSCNPDCNPIYEQCKNGVCSNIPTKSYPSGSFISVIPPFILLPGESISDVSGTTSLTMQNDGNLCITSPNVPKWCSNTSSETQNFMLFSADANISVYSGTPANIGNKLWSTNKTLSNPGLIELVIENNSATIYTTSSLGRPCEPIFSLNQS